MKFRKKPVVIDAMQLPAFQEEASSEFLDFLHAMDRDWCSERDGSLTIETLEGNHTALPGDWIIKGVKGEYYPCKPDIFDLTYESVEPPTQ